MKENILIDKSIAFAARIIKLNQYLTKDIKEFIISKQLIRSGTSIGANMKDKLKCIVRAGGAFCIRQPAAG